MIKPSVILTGLFTISIYASAEDFYSDGFSTCIGKSGGVTANMLNCIGEELATQDARLHSAYKKLAAGLTAERRRELVAVQRFWIQYRDANCKYYADPDGGTAATLASTECVLRETTERANEMEILSR